MATAIELMQQRKARELLDKERLVEQPAVAPVANNAMELLKVKKARELAAKPPEVEQPYVYKDPRDNPISDRSAANIAAVYQGGMENVTGIVDGVPDLANFASDLLFDYDLNIPTIHDTEWGKKMMLKTPEASQFIDENAGGSAKGIGTALSWFNPKRFGSAIGATIGSGIDYLRGDEGNDRKYETIGGLGGTARDIRKDIKVRNAPPLETIDDEAIQFIREHADDYETALANIRRGVAEGRKGTLAELSGDLGIANIERVAPKGSKARTAIEKMEMKRQAQNIQNIRSDFGQEVADNNITDMTQKRINEMNSAVVERTGRAGDKANLAEKELISDANQARLDATADFGTVSPDISGKPNVKSKELNTSWADAETKANEGVSAIWDKFTDGKDLDGGAITSGAFDDLAKFFNRNPRGERLFKSKYSEISKSVDDVAKGDVSPAELQSLISDIKAIVNEANKTGGDTASKALSIMGKALEKSLRETVGNTSYDDAVSASKKFYETYRPTEVASRGAKSSSPNTFGSTLMKKSDSGANTAEAFTRLDAEAPEVKQAFEQYLRSVATNKNLDTSLLDNYDELLEVFPEFKAQLVTAKNSLAKSDNLDKQVTPTALAKTKALSKAERVKTAEGLSKTIKGKAISKFTENPDKFLDSALKNPKDMESLAKQLNSISGGKDKLRDAVRTRLMKRLVKTEGGVDTLTMKSYDEFTDMKKSLIDSGTLSKAEVDDIYKTLDDVVLSSKLKSSSAAPRVNSAISTLTDVISGTSAAVTGGIIPIKNKLMLISSLKKFFLKTFNKEAVPIKTYDRINEMSADPEKFIKAIPKEILNDPAKLREYWAWAFRSSAGALREDDNTQENK